MVKFVIQFILFVILAFYIPVQAQPAGTNDPTFNPDDIGFGYGSGPNGTIYTTAMQSDGRILVGGVFTEYDNYLSPCLARVNSDGSRDASFLIGSGASGKNAIVRSIALQKDGRIIVGGSFAKFGTTTRQSLVRLYGNGSPDNTFNSNFLDGSLITSIVIQKDGKLIVGGEIKIDTATLYLARLHANGSLDTTFKISKGPNQMVNAIALQTNGKIIVAGDFISYDTARAKYIVRLDTSGVVDTSFNYIDGPNKRISSVAFQSSGKIIVAGDFTEYDSTARGRIARLNTDGSLDVAFGLGTGANNNINAVSVQSDDKILLGGIFTMLNNKALNYVSRLNAEGNLDPTFNVGVGANNIVNTVAVQSDFRAIIGGAFTLYNNGSRNFLARLNVNGSLNTSFNFGSGASLAINTASLQKDGKVIIGGAFTSYNGALKNRIMRLHPDGRVDVTFNIGSGVDALVYTSALQGNGKVIIGGDFSKYNEQKINSIARINADGTLDTSFHVGSGARKNLSSSQSQVVLATALQKDGKIWIGGQFITYNGLDRKYLARLNADGTLDASFAMGTGVNDYVTSITIQDDGKVLIGGNFTAYSGKKVNRFARINTDGTLDTLFKVGLGANAKVITSLVQSDGKILVGGDFTTFNGVAHNYLLRLNNDGSIDQGFMNRPGPTGAIHAIALQAKDSQIVIGGNFYSYNGTDRKSIARLHSDGRLDDTFNPEGLGANNTVYTLVVQPDEKLILGGNFTAYNNIGRNRLARIALYSEDVGLNDELFAKSIHLYPNPTKDKVNISATDEVYEIEVFNTTGTFRDKAVTDIFNGTEISLDAPAGLYFVSIKNAKGRHAVLKVVKE